MYDGCTDGGSTYSTLLRRVCLVDCGVEFAVETANYPKEPGNQTFDSLDSKYLLVQ
jgi:hypothetical protein